MSEFVYVERYKLPAGLLAVLVNGAFFALIIFGVSWRATPPQPMVVDMWESLPEMKVTPLAADLPPVAPVVEPPKSIKPVQPVPVKAAEPALPNQTDIALAEKRKKEEKQKETEKELQRKKKIEQEETTALQRKEIEEAERARVQAEQTTANNSIVNDYKSRILAKIKRKIKWPEEGRITAVYEVTLLPDGSVLESKLVKSSGNEAYDRQTASAIEAAQPLPLPPADQALFSQFRKLQLKFSPTE